MIQFSHRIFCCWLKSSCLKHLLLPCAGSYLQLDEECSPLNQFQIFKVLIFIIPGFLAAQSDFLASDLCLCAFTDEQEESLEERWQHSKAKCLLKRLNSEDKTKDLSDTFGTNNASRQQVAVFGNS